MTDFAEIWSYLSQGPLLWLTATLIAYALGDACFRLAGRTPLVNPVLIAVMLLAGVLHLTATPYTTYFEGAQFVHFLLGPATVALALPLYDSLPRLRRALWPTLAALVAGSLTAALSALAIGAALGVDATVLASLAPKSATAPVAIGIAERIGGSPTLTAVLVILTGITGAIIATPLLNMLRLRDWRARGFAVGLTSHGIGTARALQVHPTAGAFAALGMALNAVATALVAPYALSLFEKGLP
ncbi:MAG: LrgB family protein [Paracoccaceae bacterium]